MSPHDCVIQPKAEKYLTVRQSPHEADRAYWLFDEINCSETRVLPPQIRYCPWCGDHLPEGWQDGPPV